MIAVELKTPARIRHSQEKQHYGTDFYYCQVPGVDLLMQYRSGDRKSWLCQVVSVLQEGLCRVGYEIGDMA